MRRRSARFGTGQSDGFSLLEVIIATALLASSSILLLQLLSIGERHGTKGGDRLIAQMLAQNVLEEIATGIRPLRALEEETLPGFPEWTVSVTWVPTDLEGLVQVHVRIAKLPITSDTTTPAVEPRSQSAPREEASHTTTELGPHRSVFELTRWLRAKEASDEDQPEDPRSDTPSRGSRPSRRPSAAHSPTSRRPKSSATPSLTPRRLRRETGSRTP